MTPEQAMTFCHAYLDDQLNADTRRAIDALLAGNPELARHYDEQREFLAALKKRSQSLPVPPQLEAGIRARLATARSAARNAEGTSSNVEKRAVPFATPAKHNSFRRRWLIGAAAGIALALGATGLYWSMHEECPYMVACVTEHKLILEGHGDYAQKNVSTQALAAWINGAVQSQLSDLPSGGAFSLAPEGAGRVEFKSLRQWGSPGGAFVTYRDGNQSRVTLLVHHWPEEEPEPFNRLQVEGRVYWATHHKGYGVATWKSPDEKLVLSVIADRSKDDVLKLAEGMRAMLDAQVRPPRIALK